MATCPSLAVYFHFTSLLFLKRKLTIIQKKSTEITCKTFSNFFSGNEDPLISIITVLNTVGSQYSSRLSCSALEYQAVYCSF